MMQQREASQPQYGDLVRLADDAVIGLSSLARTGTIAKELLQEGVELCDMMLVLLGRRQNGVERKRIRAVRLESDQRTLRESGLKAEQVTSEARAARSALMSMIDGEPPPSVEEVSRMEAMFVSWTMPFWRARLGEFRERRERRELRGRG
jgi:hypothetical protein